MKSSPTYRLGLGICVLTLFLALGQPAPAVTILGSQSSISGHWQETWMTDPVDGAIQTVSGSFTMAGSGPLGLTATRVSEPNGWGSAWGVTRPLELSMGCYSAPSGAFADGPLDGTYITMLASTTTRFRSDTAWLVLALSCGADWNYFDNEQSMQLVVRDVTASVTVLELLNLHRMDESGNRQYSLHLDPLHEYELTLSGRVESFDAKYLDMHTAVWLSNVSVPDVAATAGLLVLGLLSMAAVRRRLRP